MRRRRRYGFSSLEALSCLEADDLRKSKVPIGQQKLLLRCVAKQLATSDTGDSTRDETSCTTRPIDAPPASVDHAAPSTSAMEGSGGEDAFVRQLREQLSVDQQGTRQAGRSDATNTELPGMDI